MCCRGSARDWPIVVTWPCAPHVQTSSELKAASDFKPFGRAAQQLSRDHGRQLSREAEAALASRRGHPSSALQRTHSLGTPRAPASRATPHGAAAACVRPGPRGLTGGRTAGLLDRLSGSTLSRAPS